MGKGCDTTDMEGGKKVHLELSLRELKNTNLFPQVKTFRKVDSNIFGGFRPKSIRTFSKGLTMNPSVQNFSVGALT